MIEQRQREPSQLEVAAMIADALGETETGARYSIELIVQALGRTQSRQLLNYALQAEEHGGLMLPDNSRRRTQGGVFFFYVHRYGIPKPGRKLPPKFMKRTEKVKESPVKEKKGNTTPKQSISAPSFEWDDRIAAIKEADQEKGTATVKITLIGRPGKIVERGSCIVTVMESSKIPALPKGLPTPTAVATKYAVYISSKQWQKVKDVVNDPDDALIVEGFPTTDAAVSAIAVFATNVTSKKLQAAKKQSS